MFYMPFKVEKYIAKQWSKLLEEICARMMHGRVYQ
jgi:hypothetical protein